LHLNTLIVTINNRFLIGWGYCWQRCHVARRQSIGAALLLLFGVLAPWVALLPLGVAYSLPAPAVLVSFPVGAGSSATEARKPSKAAFVDLPPMFLYSRPIRGVRFA
jgi:hypothetical protein